MCKHPKSSGLFDCEWCGETVTTDMVGYDVENGMCPYCKDEADLEAMAQFLPYSFVNRMALK